MAASMDFTSLTFFTISQPFLGAQLQFYPALQSAEFEYLLDCYVNGSASKKDKLSQVTLDFFKNATVDINTGALTKRYEVFPSFTGHASFDQSPVQSLSSGFSPSGAIYTPSPASSAAFVDSTYGSVSMTPPAARNGAGRVTKRSALKKDTKKTAEARLPGFSIMTKDGIDVTSTAGRGTKTKEQREHAHLMRQLKACAECKRKKVRCDPSHRRSSTEMSRTSTSTSSSRTNPSPTPSTMPSQQPSQQPASNMAFNSANAFDDFVLFPDDNIAWNFADMQSTKNTNQDLDQFNFDINDMDFNSFMSIDQTFGQFAPLQSGQNGMDSWAEQSGYSTTSSMNSPSHTRPHASGQYTDSEHINSSDNLFADIDWNNGATNRSPLSQANGANARSSSSEASPDWNVLEAGVIADSSNTNFDVLPPDLSPGESGIVVDHSDLGLTSSSGSSSSSSPSNLVLTPGSSLSPSSDKPIENSTDSPTQNVHVSRFGGTVQELTSTITTQPPLWYSLNDSAYNEYRTLETDLQQAQYLLSQLGPQADTVLSGTLLAQLEVLDDQLELFTVRVQDQHQLGLLAKETFNDLEDAYEPDYLRQCQVHARRLVRSLCATIASLQAQQSGSSPATGNSQMLASGGIEQSFSTSCLCDDGRSRYAHQVQAGSYFSSKRLASRLPLALQASNDDSPYQVQPVAQQPTENSQSSSINSRNTGHMLSIGTNANASGHGLLRESSLLEAYSIATGLPLQARNRSEAFASDLLSSDIPPYSSEGSLNSEPRNGDHRSRNVSRMDLQQNAAVPAQDRLPTKSVLSSTMSSPRSSPTTMSASSIPDLAHLLHSSQQSPSNLLAASNSGSLVADCQNDQLLPDANALSDDYLPVEAYRQRALVSRGGVDISNGQHLHDQNIASQLALQNRSVLALARASTSRATAVVAVDDYVAEHFVLDAQSRSDGLNGGRTWLSAVAVLASLLVASMVMAFATTTSIQPFASTITALVSMRHACTSWVENDSFTSFARLALGAIFATQLPNIFSNTIRLLNDIKNGPAASVALTLMSGDLPSSTSMRKGISKSRTHHWLENVKHLNTVSVV